MKYKRLAIFMMIIVAVCSVFQIKTARCDEEFQFFENQEMDYWNSSTSIKQPAQKPHFNIAGNISRNVTANTPESTSSKFPWSKYLDPRHDEFFKEGNYTPPAPFMEIARNPSDENIANWFHYLELKNEITHRLQARLVTYSGGQSPRGDALLFESRSSEQATHSTAPAPAPEVDAKKFRLRLYFDSKCPHCQHMLSTMSELSKYGFWVEFRQIDGDVSARGKIPFPVESATPKELKQYQISGVPVLLVGNLKNGTFFKIQGYQSTESVLQALRAESNRTPIKGGDKL